MDVAIYQIFDIYINKELDFNKGRPGPVIEPLVAMLEILSSDMGYATWRI